MRPRRSFGIRGLAGSSGFEHSQKYNQAGSSWGESTGFGNALYRLFFMDAEPLNGDFHQPSLFLVIGVLPPLPAAGSSATGRRSGVGGRMLSSGLGSCIIFPAPAVGSSTRLLRPLRLPMMYAPMEAAMTRTPRGTPTAIPILAAFVRPVFLAFGCFVPVGEFGALVLDAVAVC